MASVEAQLLQLLQEVRATPGAATAVLRAAQREWKRIKAGKRSYKETHWGERGDGGVETLRVADVSKPITLLGVLERVEYFADKRGDGPSIYYHDFSSKKPVLAYDTSGLLAIAGGSYVVNERGIVG